MLDTVLSSLSFGLLAASILSLGAVAFTLQYGVTNVLNLAFGETMIASAFVAYLVTNAGGSVWLATLVAAAFGGVFAVALNRTVISPFIKRGTGLFGMVIVTLALSLILQNVMQILFGPGFYGLGVRASVVVRWGPAVFTQTALISISLAIVLMVAVHLLLRRTRMGKAMRAVSTDPILARACGIRTNQVVDAAWLVSGILSGIAGIALVVSVPSFTATTGIEFLIPIVAAAILGGVGQPYGAMLGALIIGVSGELVAATVGPTYRDIVSFALLIGVLLWRPQGLIPEIVASKEVAA